ncbi:TPA: hypothetical protein ACH3X1_001414 [Trebouxia sp. C0004]
MTGHQELNSDAVLAGSCWAFAATGALEAAIAIANQVPTPPDLAEEEFVDCVQNGCNGGLPSSALSYALSTSKGLPLQTSYAYTAGDTGASSTCKSPSSYTSSLFDSVETVPSTVLALKQAVSQQPVAVAVDASSWTSYTGNLYSGACSSSQVDHAVLVVGYDMMSTGQEYWIIRNQWGADWGDAGYLYLPIKATDDTTGGTCGILGKSSGLPPVYPFKSGSKGITSASPSPGSASTAPPPPGGSFHPAPPPPSSTSGACTSGTNPCGHGTCQVSGAQYTCTCPAGYHASTGASSLQLCAIDGMCEYLGEDVTCIVGTCVDDPSDSEYGYTCNCGTYSPGTWSVDGSPLCYQGETDLTCQDGWVTYTTQAGDQCWNLVYTNDMTVDDFFEHNPDIDCSAIYVGTQVCVPESGSSGGGSDSGSTGSSTTPSSSSSTSHQSVSFSATLADYDTTTFLPGTHIYSAFVTTVATAANVTSSVVDIISISPGSVVVSTTVVTPSSQSSAFTSKLQSGSVFSSSTFGDVTVSAISVDGQATTTNNSGNKSGCSAIRVSLGMLVIGWAALAVAF